MKIGKVIALAALLVAAHQVVRAQSHRNSFAGPSSPHPYSAGPGPYVPVGPTLGPEEAVAPTDLGKRTDPDALLRKLALDQALLDTLPTTDSSSAPSIDLPRHRRLAPPVDLPIDLEAEIGKLQAWERSLPGALIRPDPAIDPRLPAWAAIYRAEAAKLRAAADRAFAERSLAACGDLERAIRASRIPHAPQPGLEASASAALVWLAKGAASCSHGMRDTTSLRLGEGCQALEALDRELPPASGRP